MCLLFETIKIVGGEPQNLPLHDERMNRSRSMLFCTNDILNLSDYITVPEYAKDKIFRCRVTYSAKITSIEYLPYTPAKISTLKLVDARTLAYDHKFLDRSHLLQLIDKRTADDILIVKKGLITDVSFANIAFTDGQQWITPLNPLLRGTMRELLLRRGIIREELITINDLSRFTHFRLINAMLGFEAPLQSIDNIIEAG